MDIKLAGFNIETDSMEEFQKVNGKLLTPEIFSSAYARISRSKKSVTELREDARKDVEKARRSNQKIIFDMGHHSVSEHAVFNFDLIGISRLALESIERFRLVSYTEKSQRYVTLKGDYIIPEEFDDTILKKDFIEIIELQNKTYESLFKLLREYIFNKFSDLAGEKSNKSLLEGWAKEDARYALSLATQAQLGLSFNARTLEHAIRTMRYS
ncbi:MAG: FAD-dependent thymidylate synthase, partial [Candidatus Aminicenantes bacterium]|nr:FAD-dependent thymidylate synthase [Candidatus Aminicenantes bacterium]